MVTQLNTTISKVNDIDSEWYSLNVLEDFSPPDNAGKQRLMASLATVFLDESGTHSGSNAAVVAGYISNDTEWGEFIKEWGQILKSEGVEYFHMTDFESRYGQFDGWTEERKRTFLNKLLNVINQHAFVGVGTIITKQSFDSLSEPSQCLCENMYGLAAMFCWWELGRILVKADAWMNLVMGRGAKGFDAINLIYQEDSRFREWNEGTRIRALSTADMREFLPLQAADMLAYELWKEWNRRSDKSGRDIRYPLKQLGKVRRNEWHYVSDKHLKTFNEDVLRQLVD